MSKKENYILNLQSDASSDIDRLGFEKYLAALEGMAKDPAFSTPFCVGVFGNWGSGKTSFMKILSERLAKDGVKENLVVVPVWFNPWRYEKEEHLIIPFLKTIESSVITCLNNRDGLPKKIKEKLALFSVKLTEVATAITYGMKGKFKFGFFDLTLDAAKMADREKELCEERMNKEKKGSADLSSIYYDVIGELEKCVDKKDGVEIRIIAFIDDLDRCLPEKAVELLEATKLFLDIPGYLFVIGVARDIVEKGIAERYHYLRRKKRKNKDKEEREEEEEEFVSPEKYLDKMVQLPLELPPVAQTKQLEYITFLLGAEKQENEYSNYAQLIADVIGLNPRDLKRYVNFLAFTTRVAEEVRAGVIDQNDPKVFPEEKKKQEKLLEKYFIPALYVKWTLILFTNPRLVNTISGNKRKLIELQKRARGRETEEKTEKTEAEAETIDPNLQKILAGEDDNECFPEQDEEIWIIEKFVHLNEAAVHEGGTASAGKRGMPEIGAVVRVAAGPFQYQDEKEKHLPIDEFFIDAYPVTNRQFREFVKGKGYETEACWSKGGWQWKEGEKIEQPRYWDDEQWNKDDHPVVGVSYYEAEAYCRWRTATSTKGHEYALPDEKQWELAARGEDGREYPWGDLFDRNKCNTAESEIGATTPVNNYPDGKSPNDCYDMAGNVWEWTCSDFDSNRKVLRGGSWGFNSLFARCASRNGDNPGFRYYDVGFRCTRTK